MGDSAQLHVGDGHDGIVGNGGGLWWIDAEYEGMRLERRHVDLMAGLNNMKETGSEEVILLDVKGK